MSEYGFPKDEKYGQGCKHIWRVLDTQVQRHPEHGLVLKAYCYNCGSHGTAKVQIIIDKEG